MKKLSLLIILMGTALGFSQSQGMLRGIVLDQESHNEPLMFAHVQLKGTDLSTETNFHGSFEFEDLKNGEYSLIISYAGYENIEMPLTIKNNEVVHLNLGMGAKQFNFDGIEAEALSLKKNEALLASERLPRE